MLVDDRGAHPVGPHLELFQRGRPKGVGRGNQHFAAFPGMVGGEFADRGRFSGPIDTNNQNHMGFSFLQG